jgi:lipopolysaccharide/colanic/teichoic acid biosynthesis glycosyltransferase
MSPKRFIDVLMSGLILLASAPLFALLAVLVVWNSGLPIFFRQERVGKNFKSFRILKFRSMRVSQGGPSVTVSGDSRVTRIGKLLRRTKLDELPQFWNVLRGDMSLVGPRPEVPEYVALQPERYRRILSVRPGITDPASLRFKNEESLLAASEDPLRYYADVILPAKLDMSEEYIRTRSLKADFKVLLKTALLAVPGAQR